MFAVLVFFVFFLRRSVSFRSLEQPSQLKDIQNHLSRGQGDFPLEKDCFGDWEHWGSCVPCHREDTYTGTVCMDEEFVLALQYVWWDCYNYYYHLTTARWWCSSVITIVGVIPESIKVSENLLLRCVSSTWWATSCLKMLFKHAKGKIKSNLPKTLPIKRIYWMTKQWNFLGVCLSL